MVSKRKSSKKPVGQEVHCKQCGALLMVVHQGYVGRTQITCLHCGAKRVWFPAPKPVNLHPEADD